MVKKAAAIALLAIIGFSFSNSIEATKNLTAQEILSKVEKRLSTPNENMTLKMKISAADGTNKERTLRIKRKNTEQQQRALVKLLAPSELRGVSVLSVHEGEEENQWLYLPSAGQSRQITGPGISGRFLDSDFSYEDFRFSTYRDFSSKVESYEGEGRNKMAVILSTAKEDTETAYSQVRTWIHLYHFRIEKSEYYDKEGKILKVIKFNNYQAIHKKFWRARKVRVENLQTKSTTELELKTFSTHQLKESDFSLDAMKSL